MPKMNLHRAQELIVPLRNGTANDISLAWQARLIEALEYVIEHESQPTPRAADECPLGGKHAWSPKKESIYTEWCYKCGTRR